MAKKSTRSKATRSAETDTDAAPRATGDRLVGSVWHNGKNYDPKKPADQAAFRQLVENEKKLGDKNKDGSARATLDLQRLADEGVISGFGMKSKTRKGSKAQDAEVELEGDPDAPAGGGLDAVEEQEMFEQEQEEAEE